VLIQGVGLDVINVPLHQIFLKSKLVSGPVIVGIRPTLPIEGISLILGNDLEFNLILRLSATLAMFCVIMKGQLRHSQHV